MKEQPKSRDCLKKFNGVEVFMCATTCAGLENCLIKRQRGEPVSDIISENYPTFKTSFVDVRIGDEPPKADDVVKFVNDWLWSSKDRRTINMPWTIEHRADTILMIREYCKQPEKLSGEAKTPDRFYEDLAESRLEDIRTLEAKIKELTGGSVPTPSDEERLKELANAFYAGRQGEDEASPEFKYPNFKEWLRSSTEQGKA